MHNSERLVKGKPQCTVLMHPTDAAQRNLKRDQNVVVTSRVGSVVLPVEISDEMMPGVVSIPHGWGHERNGVQLEVAKKHAGESINDLTDSQTVDAFVAPPLSMEHRSVLVHTVTIHQIKGT